MRKITDLRIASHTLQSRFELLQKPFRPLVTITRLSHSKVRDISTQKYRLLRKWRRRKMLSSRKKPVSYTPEAYTLAAKALIYGTVLATAGTILITLMALYFFGFSSLSEVLQYLRKHPDRYSSMLKKEGITEIRKEISLASLFQDYDTIVESIESMCESED